MESNDRPDWLNDLADAIEGALDASGIDGDSRAAAIFIAVRPNPDGTKHVIHEIRGKNAPLAEAVGALVYNRDFPGIIPVAAAAALQMRHLEDKARYNKNKHNHKNKKR